MKADHPFRLEAYHRLQTLVPNADEHSLDLILIAIVEPLLERIEDIEAHVKSLTNDL